MDRSLIRIALVLCITIAVCSCYHHGKRGHGSSSSSSSSSSDSEEHEEHHYPRHQHFAARVHPGPQNYGHGMGHGYGHHGQGPYGHHGWRKHDSSSDSSSSESESEDHSEEHEDHDKQEHERFWRFQVGDSFGAYEYLDNDGHARGFHIDLMRAVCRKAHKRCFFMVDTYTNCWRTSGGQELPGLGLLDNYYDGCIGNLPTPDRLNSFNFTLPYTPNIRAGLFHKPGTVPKNNNVTGLKIGFVGGWALSKRCFERQNGFIGNVKGRYIPVMFETHKAMITALLQDEVHGVLSVDVLDRDTNSFEMVEPEFICTSGGASVMTNYGSEVLGWWNCAFTEMKADGGFRRLCERSAKAHEHKGRIHCLD